MGSILGTKNNFQASNPYSADQFEQTLGNQGRLYNQQEALGEQLRQMVQGGGPNPAQTQYLQNVQNNVANAQGLIASQRGLNPALAARMGVNAATAANNQAGLGSALLQQQNQMGAIGALQNLYGLQQGGNLGMEQLYTGAQGSANQLNQQVGEGNTNRQAQLIGGVINAGGGAGAAALGAAHGAVVPGKAKVPGDSTKNDTVDAKLSPGEIVIPRSKAHDPEKAKEFVDHLLKSKGKEKDNSGYGKVASHKRKVADLEKRVKALEKKKGAA